MIARTRRTIRTKLTGVHIVIAAMCTLAMMLAPAFAQDDWYEAGVIIDYGDDRITWIWIPFEEPDTPLIDLLNSTDLEMVTVGFGGLGEGVCQIDDTGCPVGDCRQRMCQTSSSSPFWRIMLLNSDEWGFGSSGVSGTRVADGGIYALSWSAENPDLPVVTIDELAANAGANRDAANPVAAMRTDGASDAEDESAAWLPALGALGVVVLGAGVLVLRARFARGVTA